jgi:hypothetical protein
MRGLRRFGALVLASLQLGVSTAVVALDSILDGERAGSTLHVEAQDSEACATHHDHLFCQVVRSLSSATGASPVTHSSAATAVVSAVVPTHGADAIRPTLLSGSIGSRAPPLA